MAPEEDPGVFRVVGPQQKLTGVSDTIVERPGVPIGRLKDCRRSEVRSNRVVVLRTVISPALRSLDMEDNDEQNHLSLETTNARSESR